MDISPRAAANQILLLCVRRQASGAAPLRSLLDQDVDWTYLLDLARDHGLLPLLYKRLSPIPGAQVPRDVLARLEAGYYNTLKHNLRLLHTLGQIVAALREGGVEVIVLKGGALAGTLYADPGLRPMSDLDLLVRVEQVDRASTVLGTLGFHRSGGLPTHLIPFQQQIGGGVEWNRGSGVNRILVDLQHDLVGVDWCRGAFRVETEALWASSHPLTLDRVQTRQLSAPDTLLHLALHPALHHGYAVALASYVDIDWLVAQAGSDPFWRDLVKRAARFRVRTVTGYALQATRDLLGTPVPAQVLSALGPGPLRARLLRWLAPMDPDTALLGAHRSPSGLRQALLYLALADGAGAVAIIRDVVFPSAEWLAVRYGATGSPLWPHRLAHPFRLARALLRSARRPLIQSGLD
jgi:hypothetical protein